MTGQAYRAPLLFQRAIAAARAISTRRRFDSAFARAGPPFLPPRRPSTTAARFFFRTTEDRTHVANFQVQLGLLAAGVAQRPRAPDCGSGISRVRIPPPARMDRGPCGPRSHNAYGGTGVDKSVSYELGRTVTRSRWRSLDLEGAFARSCTDAIPAWYRDGELLGYVGARLRRSARLVEIDPKLLRLLLAVEDQRFWSHPGIDFVAIGRAILADLRAHAPVQGASTVAQQLLKNTMLRELPPLLRKAFEIPLAPITTLSLGRASVLERYLNTVYFGGGVYGVRLASQVFLGKEPTQLSWGEAALLAGLPANPELFGFYRANAIARDRRDYVLRRGRRTGVIGEADLSLALREPMPPPRSLNSAHRDLMTNLVAPDGALNMRTTLDRATHITATRVARRAARAGWCAIAAVDVESGEIRALATRWSNPRMGFDIGLMGAMSPGSALKPFVLSAALDAGYRLDRRFASGTVVLRVDGRTWRVENWRGQSFGNSSLSEATRRIQTVSATQR